jgi:2,5-diketo-D-gluconate reductase A
LGVWQTQPPTPNGPRAALAAGYRHIDTAAAYGNEAGGRPRRLPPVSHEDVFLVTKLWNADHGYDKTLKAFDASIAKWVSTTSTSISSTGDAREQYLRRHLQGVHPSS